MPFTLAIGKPAPAFKLPGVDGRHLALADLKNRSAVVVCFTCNHCPTSVANEDRIIALGKDYERREVAVVAINSNETKNHPTDGFPDMVTRAKDKKFNFPYLRDEKQDVAKAYGAQRTPHFFVLDAKRRVVYEGALDDSPYDAGKVKRSYVREALDATLDGRPVPLPSTPPAGCNVKWWGKDPHWMPQSLADFGT